MNTKKQDTIYTVVHSTTIIESNKTQRTSQNTWTWVSDQYDESQDKGITHLNEDAHNFQDGGGEW